MYLIVEKCKFTIIVIIVGLNFVVGVYILINVLKIKIIVTFKKKIN